MSIRTGALALGFLLAACGESSGAETDAAAASDSGATSDAGAAGDSSTGDAGTVFDGGSSPDGGPPACVPAAGGDTFDFNCSTGSNQVAVILDDVGGHTVRISGRGLGAGGGCNAVDHLTVSGPAGTVADFDVAGRPTSSFGDGFTWVEGPAGPDAAAACADDATRFDGYSLVLTGRVDGGTFTTRCGAPGGGWPAALVLTCHRGIDAPAPGAALYEDGTITAQATVARADAYTVSSIDSTVRVIAGAPPFGSGGPEPFDSSGWSLSLWADASVPGLALPTSSFWIEGPGGALGALCTTGGDSEPDPAILLRVTGTTSRGPFSTELHATGCILWTP